jgi:hypothetical protein
MVTSLTWFRNDGAPLTGGDISGGVVLRGQINDWPGAPFAPMELVNDVPASGDTAQRVRITAYAADGDESGEMVTQHWLQARSTYSNACKADAQDKWTPVGGLFMLEIGDIPPGASRTIEFRLKVPADAILGHTSIRLEASCA